MASVECRPVLLARIPARHAVRVKRDALVLHTVPHLHHPTVRGDLKVPGVRLALHQELTGCVLRELFVVFGLRIQQACFRCGPYVPADKKAKFTHS